MDAWSEFEIDFDYYRPEYARDPHGAFEDIRSRCPVAHSSAQGGFWLATRYDDVVDIFHRPEVFSSRKSAVPKEVNPDVLVPPLNLDPPDHARPKRFLNAWFTPARARATEPLVRDMANELIDGFVDAPTCDVSQQYARLIPARMICAILGVPPNHDQFTDWLRRLSDGMLDDPLDAIGAQAEMSQFFLELVEQRKAEDRIVDEGADVITHLLHYRDEDGQLYGDDQIAACANLLVGAGIDTVWSTLSSSLLYLARNTGEQQRLREHPELLPVAREEFLRAFAPVVTGREVVEDTTLHGAQLHAGEMILTSTISANRDENQFEHADTVILEREPNRHIAFGVGIHRCLGSNLARLELLVGLELFLQRMPPFRVADEDAIEWSPGPIWGPRNVPVVFER